MDVTDSGSPIQILDDGFRQRKIKTSIRNGITGTTEELLRFRARMGDRILILRSGVPIEMVRPGWNAGSNPFS